ncbi:MAG TPA: cobalamin biosynthesis protein CobW [Aestuariivirgaceae bacterium]|jgi:cobalamin biosynthesis protein CobW
MMQQKIPATIITGFLGAGKTTLIRHLLRTANGRRIALIVNEFGDIGVDGEILRGCSDGCGEDDIIELANGCICCTVADDFIPTMSKLLGRHSSPDHIIIETSGLALPQPLVRAFNWPEIAMRVTVDGVITVVDGAAVAAGRFVTDEKAMAAQRAADPNLDHDNPIEELFEDQLACADVVLVNKMDLLDSPNIDRVRHDIKRRLRPGARLIGTEHGRIDAAALLGLAVEAETDLKHRRSHHELEGDSEHDHDDFESFVVPLGEIADRDAYLKRVRRLIANHDILRLKGFLNLAGSRSRLLVQAVGPRLESYFDRPWGNGEFRSSSLVVIGMKGLNREAIAAELSA